jgi:putative hydrolase of the HAD superfamily
MKNSGSIRALFVDIGGVLLTDGWSHNSRKLAAKTFGLNPEEMESRHNQAFDTYELDKLTLEEYLSRVVFYQKRSFTRAQFRKYMFAQSKPYPKMIELVRRLKARYGLKIVVVSNEAREINSHRIRKFKLDGFVDFFISSCFVSRSILHRFRPIRLSILKTCRCSFRLRKAWEFEVFATRITSPRVRNYPHSD